MTCQDCTTLPLPASRACTSCGKPICENCSIINGEKPRSLGHPAKCGRCDFYGLSEVIEIQVEDYHSPVILLELEAGS